MRSLALALLFAAAAARAESFERIGGANSVDGTVVADITLATYDGTELYLPLTVTFFAASMAGVTSVPHVSIGTNAPNYDDVLTNTILTGLDSSALKETIQVPAAKRSHLVGSAGQVLKMRIYDAGSGSLYLFNVAVLGTGDY